jgi:LETM1 and EF-hand domain-containing protein 1
MTRVRATCSGRPSSNFTFLAFMSLWLPRSPPLALVSVARRNYPTRLRVITNSHSRHSISTSLQLNRAGPVLLTRFQSTKVTTDPSSPPPSPPAPKSTEPTEPVLSRAWKKVKHEAQHYWHGTKLLAKEVRISARLQRKILQGETLTRRERRQVRSIYLTSSNTNDCG